tara:strand:- start:1106 stop:1492 length:387 start_codon:yes stop_codon:yes gene_type:complete
MKLKYFSKNEFDCNCSSCKEKGGTGENMDLDFLLMLDKARELSGVPFKINSGYRCPEHNKKVGGVKTSSHKNIPCNASDISTKDSVTRFKVLKALLEVGFVRIGIGETFIHCDTDIDKKSSEVLWTYY